MVKCTRSTAASASSSVASWVARTCICLPQQDRPDPRLIEALLADTRPDEALAVVNDEVSVTTQDPQIYQYQARTYALLGKRLPQHRAQAEAYVLNGQYQAAIEQLELAQRAADGDFYQQSAVDARLRELRERLAEQRRDGM